ncbi:MAG TPA: 16S rRNA (uracil(1498)-N(3))-methyltransferase [Methylomusa anaerophila]|uniref:Ribosomal RNA small subunit methyltransferase E n=1 Tax=Methylomusa anaerophila TaxID=1930071 RepID=A0A348ANY1_9FIRM|nr:16S rRNA (uracil(1498)-N(3))-methyltransferase [Methylomusa anaerophila]BBB92779.1 ribosomal RNA small subunit methyltransferase E [Methylomusa anaerophila]HML87370.1 16S rRNA (uracil(1498)-N(3))-methyltransferase [Methylomusa anaerophila]
MRRFFIHGPLTSNINIINEDARHISRVLRMTVGEKLIVVGDDGQAGRATITRITPDTVAVMLEEILINDTEPPIQVWLAQGLTKGDKMDYIIQKAVELGVAGIVPVITENCVVRYNEVKKTDKVKRWQKIAAEAAKQCRRSQIPEVKTVTHLSDLFGEEICSGAKVIMCYEGDASQGIRSILTASDRQSYVIIIGPEGGFSDSEVRICENNGALTVTMGPRILRTETAALAALTVIMYQHGDLGG